MNLPILLYHHVGPLRPGTNRELTISPERFEAQIQFLVRHRYGPIGLSEWLDTRRTRSSLPGKRVVITFDDGYADTAEFALPVLRRFGFRATVYVVTGQVGGTNVWDQEWGSAAHQLMGVEQIRHWAGLGIEFGAHTRNHPDLTSRSGKELSEEVEGSAQDLARIVGYRPISFAYPYGVYDSGVRDCVARSFDAAVTCDEGLNTRATDPHLLRRAEISPSDNMLDFACRLRLGWLPVAHARRVLRQRAGAVLRRLRAAAVGA